MGRGGGGAHGAFQGRGCNLLSLYVCLSHPDKAPRIPKIILWVIRIFSLYHIWVLIPVCALGSIKTFCFFGI